MIRYHLGPHQFFIQNSLAKFEKMDLFNRFWSKDSTLWKPELDRQKSILNRLGWLTIAESMLEKVNEINEFVKVIRKQKYTDIVLLGMGGSSLCPEVLHSIFGRKPGYPNFYMLDSTDPMTVRDIETKINLRKTLFIFSSKSGGTVEPNSQFNYFWNQLVKIQKKKNSGEHFVAITDSDTGLQKLAVEKRFRKIFLNPPDIGGRFSALTYFGLVPAALIGIDIKKILIDAETMRDKISNVDLIPNNPAFYPGLILGLFAKKGIDKATFLLPGKPYPFSYWTEQLIAESTGKEGKGIIPIEGENIQIPKYYSKDRLFITIRLKDESNKNFDRKWQALKNSGFPMIEIRLPNLYSIGGEFYRWEIITAISGAVLKIDPFDQPDVQSAKDETRRLLNEFEENGRFTIDKPKYSSKSLNLYFNDKLQSILENENHKIAGKKINLIDLFDDFFSLIRPNQYLALLAFLPKDKKIQKRFDVIRKEIQKKFLIATLQGYGPRYLHSIGQLYKGGQNTGLFLLFTITDKKDLNIPGKKYTFGQLKTAQAIGDEMALISTNRIVMRIDLGKNYIHSMDHLIKIILKSIK